MKNAIFSQVSSNLYTHGSNGFQVIPNSRKRLAEAPDHHVTKQNSTNPGFINLPINRKRPMLVQEHESPRTRREKVPREKSSQKLSDKITALQKLVSPFGKTDTASVLLEASMSIKSLQHQIKDLLQMLTVDSVQSRGICLFPVSLLEKLTDDYYINPPDYTLGTHI